MKNDNSLTKYQVQELKEDVRDLKIDVKQVKEEDLPDLKRDVSNLKTTIAIATTFNIGAIILGLVATKFLQ